MKTKSSLLYYILLIVGVIVLINILSDKFFFRLDFTEDKRYTLSQATHDIIDELEDPVTITAYFSENLPPDVAQIRADFKDLLVEYSNSSGGMIVYEFVNPNEDEEKEMKAMQAGIQPVLINVRDKDQAKQQKAFLGAVIQLGEEKDVIPFMQQGAAMEYALSSSIKKLSVLDKPTIGFLQGHGEPSMRALNQVSVSLSILYDVQPVFLNDSTSNLDTYSTLAIVAPTDSFPESHLRQLDEYLAKGKNLFIAMNRVTAELSNPNKPPSGSELTTGLESWLAKKGLTVENNFVVDESCGSVGVRQQQGMFSFMRNVSFPYLPVLTNFADHPISKGLEAVVLQFASSITFTGDSTIKFTPIVKTSERSGTQSSPVYFDIMKQWSPSDLPLSGITVGAVAEGKFAGQSESKIVLIADGDFAVSGEGQQQQLQPDNVSLMVNGIDWLSDDTGLIELRTKGVSMRPLDQIEDGTKLFLKLLNFLLPILGIIIYGVFRMIYKRNLRMKRMEEYYV